MPYNLPHLKGKINNLICIFTFDKQDWQNFCDFKVSGRVLLNNLAHKLYKKYYPDEYGSQYLLTCLKIKPPDLMFLC